MLKRIQSSKFVKIKLLGLTIYKRDTDSERQYILKSLLTIKKNQTHKTIRLLGIKIYSKKIITNKKKSDNLNQSDNLWFVPTIPSDDDWNRLSPCKYTHSTRCVVVLPVYKGLNELYAQFFMH